MNHYKIIKPPTEIKLLLIAEAPPLSIDNYFYKTSSKKRNHGRHRSFFRGIMQGIGLLRIGQHEYLEQELRDTMLSNGYFLIDTCPIPLVDDTGNQLPRNKKIKVMFEHVESLRSTINSLNPNQIIFICSTNQPIMDKLKNEFSSRYALDHALPYPGTGWLIRPKTKDGFIDLFPKELRL